MVKEKRQQFYQKSMISFGIAVTFEHTDCVCSNIEFQRMLTSDATEPS